MTVAEKIKVKRTENGLTVKQLASLSGVSKTCVLQYERGKTQPRIKHMIALSRALSVPLSFLFDLGQLTIPIYAKNILVMRSTRRWTQARLGMETHVSGETVSKWERGESEPTATDLLAISKLFDVSVDYILTNTDY